MLVCKEENETTLVVTIRSMDTSWLVLPAFVKSRQRMMKMALISTTSYVNV